MKFTNPAVLFALAAVAIPILVHLFNFRKFKKVYFSNLAFLKEVKVETQSKSKLKHYLILASRILAVAAVVFAFARPFIPVSENKTNSAGNSVSIYIDNSFSMDAESADGRLLNLARSKALEIVKAFGPTDCIRILTNDFEGRHGHPSDAAGVASLIAEVETGGYHRNLEQIIKRQLASMASDAHDRKHMFIISDFGSVTPDDLKFETADSLPVHLVPCVASSYGNLSVDSAWFEAPVHRPGLQERLSVRVSNNGDADVADVPMTLTVNGEQKSFGTFSAAAGISVDTALYFMQGTPGFKHLKVSIDDRPVVFDNDYHLACRVADKAGVYIVSETGSSPQTAAVFNTDPFYAVSQSARGALNYDSAAEADLLVLSQPSDVSDGLVSEIEKQVAAGRDLVIFPPEINAERLNPLLEAFGAGRFRQLETGENRCREINAAHPLFKGLFASVPDNPNLPVAAKWWGRESIAESNETPLLTYQSGEKLLTAVTHGAGTVYVFNVPLSTEWSNLVNHALFPGILLRIGETAVDASDESIIIGQDSGVILHNKRISGDQNLTLTLVGQNQTFIPEKMHSPQGTEVFIPEDLRISGGAEILLDETPVYAFGLNYSRAESAQGGSSADGVAAGLKAAGFSNVQVLDGATDVLSAALKEASQGKALWRTFLIWALIFIALEIVLIKFLR